MNPQGPASTVATKLVIIWTCAPFGVIKPLVWFYKFAPMHRHLNKVIAKVERAIGKRHELTIGYHFAQRMVDVYGVDHVHKAALSQIKITDGGESYRVDGDAFYVGVYVYLQKNGMASVSDDVRK